MTRRALPVVIVLIIYNISAGQIMTQTNLPLGMTLFLMSQETHENPMDFNDFYFCETSLTKPMLSLGNGAHLQPSA